MWKKSSLPGAKILKRKKKPYKKESKQNRTFSFYINHKDSLLFATGNSEHFLNTQIFLISLKKILTFHSRIISDHLCFCFLWGNCVLWKLRNSVSSSSSPPTPHLLAGTHNGPPFPFSVVERMEMESQGSSEWIDISYSASEVKTVTREKNIFSSKPKKRTFLLVLAHACSQCWSLPESSSVPLINRICKWNHLWGLPPSTPWL